MEKAKKSRIIRILRVAAGVLLVLFGIVGLFLPILQGVLFIFAGIVLIFPASGEEIIKKIKKCFSSFRRR